MWNCGKEEKKLNTRDGDALIKPLRLLGASACSNKFVRHICFYSSTAMMENITRVTKKSEFLKNMNLMFGSMLVFKI